MSRHVKLHRSQHQLQGVKLKLAVVPASKQANQALPTNRTLVTHLLPMWLSGGISREHSRYKVLRRHRPMYRNSERQKNKLTTNSPAASWTPAWQCLLKMKWPTEFQARQVKVGPGTTAGLCTKFEKTISNMLLPSSCSKATALLNCRTCMRDQPAIVANLPSVVCSPTSWNGSLVRHDDTLFVS